MLDPGPTASRRSRRAPLPWTLADEEVWARTHRWGGRVFIAGGTAMITLAATGLPASYAFAVLLLAALAPCVYSFLMYRSLLPAR